MGCPSVQPDLFLSVVSVSPLNRWNVVKPIPGLTNTSSISPGRITKVPGLICEKAGDDNDARIIATLQNSLVILSTFPIPEKRI